MPGLNNRSPLRLILREKESNTVFTSQQRSKNIVNLLLIPRHKSLDVKFVGGKAIGINETQLSSSSTLLLSSTPAKNNCPPTTKRIQTKQANSNDDDKDDDGDGMTVTMMEMYMFDLGQLEKFDEMEDKEAWVQESIQTLKKALPSFEPPGILGSIMGGIAVEGSFYERLYK